MQKKLGVIKMYKLRIYKLSDSDKGNLDHEEMFDTKEQMDKRYDECKMIHLLMLMLSYSCPFDYLSQ